MCDAHVWNTAVEPTLIAAIIVRVAQEHVNAKTTINSP